MIGVIAAALVAIACVGLATLFVRPDRSFDRRVQPYTQYSRARLGAHFDVETALSPQRSGRVGSTLTAPLLDGARRLVEDGLDAAEPDQLTLRLRRAGETDARPDSYRQRQLRAAALGSLSGAVVFGVMAVWNDGSWWLAGLVGGIVGVPAGALMYRGSLERRAAQRAKMLRLEVYSVTLALSVLCRAGFGPLTAIREVTSRGGGLLCTDLRHGLHWMDRGVGGLDVLDRLARETSEPSVARLLRLLASASATGSNPARALRDLAEQLRRQRIEQLDQWATKRRAAMLIPTMFFMFPVIVLFALAPGPSVIFGI